jgi:hypothetical protein
MALSQADKLLVAEYVFAGLIAREVADRLLSGRVTKAEMSLFRSLVRTVGGAAGRQALRMGGTAVGVARAHPLLTAGAIAYVAHTQGVSLDTARAIAEQEIQAWRAQPQFFVEEQLKERIRGIEPTVLPGGGLGRGQPAASRAVRRKISRANTAVKQGMKWLKAGTKAATGAMPGTHPVGAFRIVTKAAGMANPKTKSKPGKGKSMINKLARRLKKWW